MAEDEDIGGDAYVSGASEAGSDRNRKSDTDASDRRLKQKEPVKVVYGSMHDEYDPDKSFDDGPSLWRRALRWTAVHFGIPVLTVSAALGGGVYYGVTHAEDINQAVFDYQKHRAHEEAPTYGNILTQLRMRNGVHRRYDEIDDIRRGVESICAEIDRVDGYECSRVIRLPRVDRAEPTIDDLLPFEVTTDEIIR